MPIMSDGSRITDSAKSVYQPQAEALLRMSTEWARLLTRLQQLQSSGAVVVIDLKTMTLRVCGKSEKLSSGN